MKETKILHSTLMTIHIVCSPSFFKGRYKGSQKTSLGRIINLNGDENKGDDHIFGAIHLVRT